MLVLPFSVNPLGVSKTVTDEVHVLLRRGDAPFRFFLEGVQDVDGLRIADGVDSTPRAACLTRDNFKHRAAAKSSQRLCGWIGLTLLGGVEGLAEIAPNCAGEAAQVSPAGADPDNRAPDPSIIHKYVYWNELSRASGGGDRSRRRREKCGAVLCV